MRNRAVCLIAMLFLGACGRAHEPDRDDAPVTAAHVDVVVIGAGLSGLYTAMLLEDAGLGVQVLEARDRIGGRLYTLDDVPGMPEAGGNVIGASYARVIDTARRLGVELVPAGGIAGGRGNQALHVSGRFIAPGDWANSPANPFPDAFKSLPPAAVGGALLRDNPLAEASDWLKPDMHRYDVPFARLLEESGFSERGIELAWHSGSYGSSAAEASLLQLYKLAAVRKQAGSIVGPLRSVKGGNQRLPEAMAATLRTPVLMNHRVTRIVQNDTGIDVFVNSGQSFSARRVVAAVSFPALRNIAIAPDLPVIQRRAIDELSYNPVVQAHIEILEPYSGELPPSVWTDELIERVFAFAESEGGVLTNAIIWINGSNAEKLGALPVGERDAAIMESFFSVYPAAKGKVRLRHVVDWGSDPLAGGSWADWQPGQISEFINHMSQPIGRLHFAGEHTAVANPGMESAMESGERAAGEVIAALKDNLTAQLLFQRCQACHSKTPGSQAKTGPNLAGVVGRAAAALPDFAYSEALNASGVIWDRETLTRWLHHPGSLVPGTTMIYQNTLTDQEITRLIDYLEQ